MGLVVRLVEMSVSDDQSRSGTDFLKRWTESQAWSKGRPYFAARKVNPILHIGKDCPTGRRRLSFPYIAQQEPG
ncbi:hypothetical protein ACRRTK_007185 [Alexandromys fortis]